MLFPIEDSQVDKLEQIAKAEEKTLKEIIARMIEEFIDMNVLDLE